MSSLPLLAQLQNSLGREDVSDLIELLEYALQADPATAALAGKSLLEWATLSTLPMQDEEELDVISKWAPSLMGPEAFLPLAKLYYQFGLTQYKTYYLKQALDWMKKAYDATEPSFTSFHLWAKIYASYGRLLKQESALEESLQCYVKALCKEGESADLYWDWALTWQALYDLSLEPADLRQSLDYFKKAQNLGASLPEFLIDYAFVYQRQANRSGDPQFLNKAISLLRKGTHHPSTEMISLQSLAQAHARLALMTYSAQDLERANLIFEEVIAQAPTLADLWLYWGQLLFQFGWKTGQVKLIEEAIEKLTSLKVSESDPIMSTSLLSQALMGLGVLLDDGKLLFDGYERISKLLELYPDEPSLCQSEAFAFLTRGIYFSDSQLLQTAIDRFLALTQHSHLNIEAHFGLFEAYFQASATSKDGTLLQQAYRVMERICQWRPFCPLFHTLAAEMILCQYRQDPQIKNAGRFVEKAIGYLQKALSVKEDFEAAFQLARAWDMMGEITQDEGCFDRAVKIFEKLYAKLPTDHRIQAFLGLSLCHLAERREEAELLFRATTLFEKALNHDPENAALMHKLGYAKLLASVLANDPNHPELSSGWRYQAEQWLKRSAKMGCHEAYFDLACLYSLSKHFEHAIDCLKKAELYHVLPKLEDLEHNIKLEDLRQTELFTAFVSQIKKG